MTLPILALSQLQSFKLSHYTAYEALQWGAFVLFLVCVIGGFIILAVIDDKRDVVGIPLERPKGLIAGVWASFIAAVLCLVAGICLLGVPISFGDVYTYKTSGVTEITPLTADYQFKLASGKTITLDRGAVKIHHAPNNFSYGQCLYHVRRRGVTKEQATTFDQRAEGDVDKMVRAVSPKDKADLYLTDHDAHQLRNLGYKQTMQIKH